MYYLNRKSACLFLKTVPALGGIRQSVKQAKGNENTEHERKVRNRIERNKEKSPSEVRKREERSAYALNVKFGKTREKRHERSGRKN